MGGAKLLAVYCVVDCGWERRNPRPRRAAMARQSGGVAAGAWQVDAGDV